MTPWGVEKAKIHRFIGGAEANPNDIIIVR